VFILNLIKVFFDDLLNYSMKPISMGIVLAFRIGSSQLKSVSCPSFRVMFPYSGSFMIHPAKEFLILNGISYLVAIFRTILNFSTFWYLMTERLIKATSLKLERFLMRK
jgi:hypothetical protein